MKKNILHYYARTLKNSIKLICESKRQEIAACYIVHDNLDIHILDCVYCLGTCNFNCGESDLVTYKNYD